MTANHIQTVFGYQTNDGQKFHELGEAQKHTRRSLYGIIFDRAVAADLKFARLDKDLMMDFLMTGGSALAKIANDPLTASEPVFNTGGKVEVKTDGSVPFRPRTIDPQAASRAFAERSVDTLKTAMANVTEAEKAAAAREKFGVHPLDADAEASLEAQIGDIIRDGAQKNAL